MSTILSDKTKFLQLGLVSFHDNNLKIESALQRRLLTLNKQNKLGNLIMKLFAHQAVTDLDFMVYLKSTN